MNKKMVSLGLATLLLSSAALVGCQEEEVSTAKVWSALSTEKYMQSYEAGHDMLSKMGKTQAKLDFVGMRGETQSMQLMITANEYVKGYNLATADLKTSDGTTLSKENIKVYVEHYVEVYSPYVNAAKHGEQYYSDAGFYPDALVPIEAYRKTREDRIQAGKNQGIWVDIEIPADIAAGEYSGSFTLTLNDDTSNPETMNVPVTLKVYDLSMYEEVHSRTMFNIWYSELANGESDNYDMNTNQAYYDYLLSKRLCSGDVNPNYTKNLTDYISHITELAEDPRVTVYRIPDSLIPNFDKNKMCPKEYNPASPTEEELLYQQYLQDGLETVLERMLEKNLELRNNGDTDADILKKAMFYFEDEPTAGYRCERVKIFCSKLKLAKDAVAAKYAADLETYPDLKESLMGIQEICPSIQIKYEGRLDVSDPDLGDGLTLWCPEQYVWKDSAVRNIIQEHRNAGETFWWYTCVCNSPVMSYYIETIPASMRMSSWMQYDYDIEGVLYWDVVHWSQVDGADPYKDVQYKEYGGGEGILLYPGAKYGMKTPISSMRLEQLRAGQQDYEYFYMLQEYLTENEMETTAQEIVAKIGANFYTNAYFNANISETQFEEYRISILDILQDFADDKASDATAKINKIMQ